MEVYSYNLIININSKCLFNPFLFTYIIKPFYSFSIHLHFPFYSNLIYYNGFLPLLHKHIYLCTFPPSNQTYFLHVIFPTFISLHNIFHLPISLLQFHPSNSSSIFSLNNFFEFRSLCFIEFAFSEFYHASSLQFKLPFMKFFSIENQLSYSLYLKQIHPHSTHLTIYFIQELLQCHTNCLSTSNCPSSNKFFFLVGL